MSIACVGPTLGPSSWGAEAETNESMRRGDETIRGIKAFQETSCTLSSPRSALSSPKRPCPVSTCLCLGSRTFFL
jgi:hypothetical protein